MRRQSGMAQLETLVAHQFVFNRLLINIREIRCLNLHQRFQTQSRLQGPDRRGVEHSSTNRSFIRAAETRELKALGDKYFVSRFSNARIALRRFK